MLSPVIQEAEAERGQVQDQQTLYSQSSSQKGGGQICEQFRKFLTYLITVQIWITENTNLCLTESGLMSAATPDMPAL